MAEVEWSDSPSTQPRARTSTAHYDMTTNLRAAPPLGGFTFSVRRIEREDRFAAADRLPVCLSP